MLQDNAGSFLMMISPLYPHPNSPEEELVFIIKVKL